LDRGRAVFLAAAAPPGQTVSKRASLFTSDLALIAGTVLATLAVQKHLSKSLQATGEFDKTPAIQACSENPLRVIFAHWKIVFAGTYRRINRDRILATAAGVVFYGLLAIFPAITALVSSYGLFANPSTISGNVQSLALMLPEGSIGIVEDEIERVLTRENSTLGLIFTFGLVLAIWSANAGMKAILDALNVANEVEEQRGFIRLSLVSLAFTIAALAAILLMIAAVVLVPLLLEHFGLGHRLELLVQTGRWPVLAMVLLAGLLVLYSYGPSRKSPGWRWLIVGAAVAVALWLIGSSLLSWYLSNFGNYTATYGSLGAAIGLMIWMWMSAIIILFGAELNSEIERTAAAMIGGKTVI
jgi:membrane protein